MLDPNYLLHISEGAEEISEQLHADIVKRIINRIMLRIGRGENYILTAQDKWQIENLQQAGYLLEDIQKDIAKATKLQQTEIAEAMEDAGVKAIEYDNQIYSNVGLSATPLTQSPELIRLMQRNYEATMGEWNNFTRTTAEQAQRLFISEMDKSYNLVLTGSLSYTQAVKEMINTIVSQGVRVDYPTGHSDTIETATLRAVRTGISQATAQIQLSRMNEMEVDLVITSSHLGARPSHQVWQGKIFSRSGRSKYPSFIESTGYGSVTGLCGANCRHSFSPYFEGMDNPFEQYDSEENLKQYEKESRQRTLERRIRNTKREVMGLKESVDNCKDDKLKFELDMEYQIKSALLAKQNKAYKDYCDKNGLKPLYERIQIAKWDRQQAANARGAAKRYKNAHKGNKIDLKEQSLRTKNGGEYGVNWKIVKSKEYTDRFNKISDNPKANMLAAKRSRNALVNRSGKNTEELYAISLTSGKDIAAITNQNIPFGVNRTVKFDKNISRSEQNNEKVLFIHNHPRSFPPSIVDINELLSHKNAVGITVGHNGNIYYYTKPNRKITKFDSVVAKRKVKKYNGIEFEEKYLEELAKQFEFTFKKL